MMNTHEANTINHKIDNNLVVNSLIKDVSNIEELITKQKYYEKCNLFNHLYYQRMRCLHTTLEKNKHDIINYTQSNLC